MEPEDETRFNAELFARDADLTEDRLIEKSAAERSHVMRHVADTVLRDAGFATADENAIYAAELAVMLLKRRIDLQATKRAWTEGNVGHLPPQLVEPVGPTSPPPPLAAVEPGRTSRTLNEAIGVFIADMRQRGATEKHVSDAMVDFRTLLDGIGADRQVHSVSAVDAGKLWEALRALPARYGKHPDLAGLDTFGKAQRA
jgi:hypothetical protein